MYSLIKFKNKLPNLIECFLCLFLFLLPFQTRLIYQAGFLNGFPFEYGTLSFYGTEILAWATVFLFSIWSFSKKDFWKTIFVKKNYHNKKILLAVFPAFLFFIFFKTQTAGGEEVASQWILHLIESWCIFAMIVVLINKNEAAATLKSNNQEKFLWAFYLGAFLQALISIWQFFNQAVFASKWLGTAKHLAFDGGASVIEFAQGRYLRAYGFFGSPNSLGIYLACAFVAGLILFSLNQRSSKKIIWLLTLSQLLILFGLFLTFSRAAYLSALAGVLVFLFFKVFKKNENFKDDIKPYLLTGSSCVIFILILIIVFWQFLGARLNFNNRLEARSINERITQYEEGKDLFKGREFLGVGAGNYTLALFQKNKNKPGYDYQPAHNIYFLSLIELGIIKAFFYWFLILFLLIKIYQNQREFLGLIASLLIFGLFDHWLFTLYTGLVFFWLIFAISLKRQTA